MQHPFRFRLLTLLGILMLAALSCSTSMPASTDEEEMDPEQDTVIFLPRLALGQVPAGLNEISGMASSLNTADNFWVHNDSGDKPVLYCINQKAELLQTLYCNGITHRDWEDIATIRFPSSGKSKIIIADIGDNAAAYSYNTLYILDEPDNVTDKTAEVSQIQKITYRYADGQRDAETLLADPLTGDLFILSKREMAIGVYRIPYPYNTNDTLLLEKMLTLPFTQVVAGDIAASGKDIAIKTYSTVYYWLRKPGKSVTETLSSTPWLTSYITEAQGEALCWNTDGSAFFTLSEEGPFKNIPVLFKYQKKP
jgi:hypothetical protein